MISALLLPLAALAGGSPLPSSLAASASAAVQDHARIDPQEAFFRPLTFDEAKEVALKEQKLILVYWSQSGNERCQTMERLTWPDPGVQAWVNSVAIPLTIEGEKNLPVSQRWRINTFPTTTVHSNSGKLLELFHGYHSPEALLSVGKTALHGRTADGSVAKPSGDAAQDPTAWLAYANALFRLEDQVDAAIQAYLWLLDHTQAEFEPFLDQNIDFVLKRLMVLDQTNTRCKVMVRERRDELRTLILDGMASAAEARYTTHIDLWMNKIKDSLDLFEELETKGETHSHYRLAMFDRLLPYLVDWQKYDAIRAVGGDLAARALAALQPYKVLSTQIAELKGEAPLADLAKLEDLRTSLADAVPDYYETLLALGQGEDATTVANAYLELFQSSDAYVGLMQRAGRLEMKAVARKLCEQGVAAVPESDPRKARLSRVMARIESGQRLGQRDTDMRKEVEESLRKQREGKEPPAGGDGSDGDGDGDGG